jgi:hypothetical protein
MAASASRPRSISIRTATRCIVADSQRNRLQVYKKVRDYTDFQRTCRPNHAVMAAEKPGLTAGHFFWGLAVYQPAETMPHSVHGPQLSDCWSGLFVGRNLYRPKSSCPDCSGIHVLAWWPMPAP